MNSSSSSPPDLNLVSSCDSLESLRALLIGVIAITEKRKNVLAVSYTIRIHYHLKEKTK